MSNGSTNDQPLKLRTHKPDICHAPATGPHQLIGHGLARLAETQFEALLSNHHFSPPARCALRRGCSESFRGWWARSDLNRGPSDYESLALTN